MRIETKTTKGRQIPNFMPITPVPSITTAARRIFPARALTLGGPKESRNEGGGIRASNGHCQKNRRLEYNKDKSEKS